VTSILADLNALLQPAQDAQDAVAAADLALTSFDTVGPWADYITKSNSVRTQVYGDLNDVPFANPALKLPTTYAEAFFFHDTSRRGAGRPRSSTAIAADMTPLRDQLALLQAELVEAEARETQDAVDAAQLEADQKALEAAKAESKQADEKAKELKEKVAKGKKKKKK
jgi:hypothetical protein